MNKLNLIPFTIIFGLNMQSAQADICPLPPTSINPILSSKSSYDKKTQLYRYQYTIKNGLGAQVPISNVGLFIDQAPTSALFATHWQGRYVSLGFAPSAYHWFSNEVADPNKVDDHDTSIPEPLYDIKPGASLSGFEISSPNPPGITEFYAEGFAQVPTGTPTQNNDEPTPNCPGWNLEGGSNRIYGVTVGPSDPAIVDVKIRVREEKGLKRGIPIEPKNPTGKLAVLVFSTKTFDATQIDPAATYFGPGFAVPISSQAVPQGHGEEIGVDERNEWEKVIETIRPEHLARKDAAKNMLLIFDIAALDVQCKLDQALVLRGKTRTGQQFVGAISANVVGCQPHDIGKHKKHRFPFRWWQSQVKH